MIAAEKLHPRKRNVGPLIYFSCWYRSAARALLRGHTVESEMFDMTTVAFSEIWGFAVLVSIQTPLLIVELLNDLYNCIDDLVSKYDVYKVETIKDSYMVSWSYVTFGLQSIVLTHVRFSWLAEYLTETVTLTFHKLGYFAATS